jgi:hypothetical protein
MSAKQPKYRVVTMHQVRPGGSVCGWTIETCGDGPSQGASMRQKEAQAEAKRLTDQAEVSSGRT